MTLPELQRPMFQRILKEKRSAWLTRSLIRTLGWQGYVNANRGRDLRRVLEVAEEPRLIAHPTLAEPLRKNMGWLGRLFGYTVVSEPFMDEARIAAMDFARLNDWKNPVSTIFDAR